MSYVPWGLNERWTLTTLASSCKRIHLLCFKDLVEYQLNWHWHENLIFFPGLPCTESFSNNLQSSMELEVDCWCLTKFFSLLIDNILNTKIFLNPELGKCAWRKFNELALLVQNLNSKHFSRFTSWNMKHCWEGKGQNETWLNMGKGGQNETGPMKGKRRQNRTLPEEKNRKNNC